MVAQLRYTPSPDVWSLFMLMLEVWSRGQRPFRDFGASQVHATLQGAHHAHASGSSSSSSSDAIDSSLHFLGMADPPPAADPVTYVPHAVIWISVMLSAWHKTKLLHRPRWYGMVPVHKNAN